jgi:ABC-2 type transport system permease protein
MEERMKSHSLVFEIARWEFHRWFKWKDQIVTLAISLALALAIWGGMALLKSNDAPVKLAVIGQDILPFEISVNSRIELRAAEAEDEERLREHVSRGEIDGLLIIESVDEVELLVYKEPFWKSEVEQCLTEARTQLKIQGLRLPSSQLDDAMRPITLAVAVHEGGHKPASLAEKITAGLVIGVMLFGIFTGAAYQFVAITGEKQLRVTEMVISAVTPQQWIDGKILGVSAYALAFTFTTVTGILLFVFVSLAFGSGWTIPMEVTNPFIILSLILLGLGGFLLWNTVFAAVSATVNDPNTSARGTLLLAPFAPAIFAIFAYKNPDSIGMQILSIVPFTSPAVLPARLVLTEVAWWEVAVALLLLALSIWFFRSASGKIFRLGMLMHGKEPSFKEVWRWAREA